MATSLVEELKTLVVEHLDLKLGRAEIADTTPLFEGGMELDSFAIVELITQIEQRYGFQFTDADLRPEHFVDLRAVALLVEQRAAAGAG